MRLTEFGRFVVLTEVTTEQLLRRLEIATKAPKHSGEVLSITCALYCHLMG